MSQKHYKVKKSFSYKIAINYMLHLIIAETKKKYL